MHNYENHFIDSNVILGFIIEGLDSKYGNYFSLSFDRYASQNVYNECENVLNNNKTWILRFIKVIKKEFDVKKIENYKEELSLIIGKVGSFFYNPSTIMGKKVLNVLSSFSENHESELKSLITGSFEFKVFQRNITDANKKARKKLMCVFDEMITEKNGHPAPIKDFFQQYQKLKGMGMHKNDFILIVDTYFISYYYVKEDLAFITFDGHIILLKKTIEDEFYIKVFKPT
jgi:hypothetical protein